MPTYSFQMSAGLAGSSVSVTAAGSTDVVASGTLDTNAQFTASLPVGDYVATAAGGHYSYRSAGTVVQSDPDQLADLSSTYGRPMGSTVVLLGDSISAQSSENAGPNDTDTGTANYMFKNTGYFGWAQTLMGHRFHLIRNSGISGQRSDQMLARIQTDVVAFAPAWCVVLAGTNDVNQSVAGATIQANLQAIYDTLLSNGIQVIACTIPPLSAATTTAQKQALHGTNNWIRDYVRTHRGLILVDWHAALSDPATGAPAAGMTGDGTHPTGAGAYLIGKVFADAVTPFIPPSITLLGSNADPYNLLTNGRFTGTSGSIPAGVTGPLAASWTANWNTTAGAATLSQPARTDGIQGGWQQVQLTSLGTFQFFQQASPLSAWGLAAGNKVRAEIEFEADADWSAVTRFGIDVSWFNGGHGSGESLFNASNTYGNPRKGVLRTPIVTIPSDAARAQVYVRFWGTAGTVRFDRARFVKVS